MSRELDEAVSEAQYWKTVAVYLAQCHSGNASIVDLRSTSKYQRKRLVSIMRKCKGWLLKTIPAPSSHLHNVDTTAQNITDTIAWLEVHHSEVKEQEV